MLDLLMLAGYVGRRNGHDSNKHRVGNVRSAEKPPSAEEASGRAGTRNWNEAHGT